MTQALSTEIDQLRSLPLAEALDSLLEICAKTELDTEFPGRQALIDTLLRVVEGGEGDGKRRLQIGEHLGRLGDPRLRTPAQDDYWACIPTDEGQLCIGRHMVTNAEYAAFAQAGGYEPGPHWSEEGLAWLEQCEDPWTVRAKAEDSRPFVVPNQPVVGITWWEAEAYAAFHGARLPRFDERLLVTRGSEKRPYPWGSPFGAGNANTREEVLSRPCAVGLYRCDRTPEGVCDLAGNAAEWTAEGVGRLKWIHPGSWDQPSMAAWAKARSLEEPESRWAGLGFRLARD